jgi:hypothetical protein
MAGLTRQNRPDFLTPTPMPLSGTAKMFAPAPAIWKPLSTKGLRWTHALGAQTIRPQFLPSSEKALNPSRAIRLRKIPKARFSVPLFRACQNSKLALFPPVSMTGIGSNGTFLIGSATFSSRPEGVLQRAVDGRFLSAKGVIPMSTGSRLSPRADLKFNTRLENAMRRSGNRAPSPSELSSCGQNFADKPPPTWALEPVMSPATPFTKTEATKVWLIL